MIRSISLLAAVGLSSPGMGQIPADPEPRPNIVLIVIDDVGVDMLEVYGEGAQYPATPNIDGLAQAGVTFRNAYANPLCSTTRATLMTGRYGFRNTVGSLVNAGASGHDLPRCEVTLPEALCILGYDSAVTGKWHLTSGGYLACDGSGPLSLPPGYAHGPIEHGFDYFAGASFNADSYFVWDRVEHVPPAAPVIQRSIKYAPEKNVEDALDWVEQQMVGPWFLYLPFYSAHAPLHIPPDGQYVDHPYLPPAGTLFSDEANTATRREHFTAMIEAMDFQIGELLDGLQCQGQLDNTWIVLVGDNGTDQPVKLPYGSLPSGTCNGVPVLPDHVAPGKRSLFEGGINVPLIVSGPPGWVHTPGRFDNGLVNTTDVYATVCELAGAPVPSVAVDSFSLVPILENPAVTTQRPFAYSEIFPPPQGTGYEGRAARNSTYKLIRISAPYVAEYFFDLQSDPCELDDLMLHPSLSPEQSANFDALSLLLDRIDDHPLQCTESVPCLPSCP